MGKLFNLDSPVMSGLSRLADLIFLNLLVLVCCIPVITVGASMTALHYVLLKMVKNEEGYITRSFFKSFKENFKQATIIWLILLLVICILIGDFLIFGFSGIKFPGWLTGVLIAVSVMLLVATIHLFPLLSRFENTVMNTYKNSFLIGILNLPKTIVMIVCWAIPLVIIGFLPQIFPVVFALGISGPAYLNAMLYKKSFARFEPESEETSDEEWTIEELPEEDGEAEPAETAEEAEGTETEESTGQQP